VRDIVSCNRNGRAFLKDHADKIERRDAAGRSGSGSRDLAL